MGKKNKRWKNNNQPPNPPSGETKNPDPAAAPQEQAKPKQTVVVVKPRTLGLGELIQRACLYSDTKEEQDQLRTQFLETFSSLTPDECKVVGASLGAMRTSAAVAIIRSIGLNSNRQAAVNEIKILAINNLHEEKIT